MNEQSMGSKPVETEYIPPGALEAISRAEIDIAIATARKYPQHSPDKLATVKQNMLSFATLDQETAEACFYSLPRGGKVIQGPTVRLAEIAVACYGNLRAGTRIIETVIDGADPHVVIQAVAMDLEKNIQVSIEKRRRILKKKSKDKPDEDDVNLATNACSAIAFRDSVYKVIPMALIKPVYEAAKKVAVGDARTLADRRNRCFETFSKMGIQKERVLAKLEKKSIEEVNLEDLEMLIGLYTALKDGEAQIDEVFAPQPRPPTPTGHQQATAPTTPTNPPVKPPGAVPTASEPAKAVVTPPEASKPAEPPATPQPEPNQGTVAPDDTAELAAMGLAPEFENGAKPEQQAEKQGEKGEFVPNPNESAGLQGVRRLMHDSDVTDAQLLKWAVKNKLAKDGQSLGDLAEQKLASIAKSWAVILPKIQSV